MTEAEQPGQARFWQLDVAGPFFIVALIWGSTWLVIKDQIGSVPPSWSVTWRFTAAAVGMAALALVRRESLRVSDTTLKVAALLGLLQFVMNFQFGLPTRSFRFWKRHLNAILCQRSSGAKTTNYSSTTRP